MAPLPSVPNVMSSVITWAVDADTKAITRHYWSYTGSAPSAASCVSFAGGFVNLAATPYEPLCTTGVGMESCEVTDLSSPSGGQGAGGTPWIGTRTGAVLPPASSVVVSHQIARRYRGGKPRSYMPFGGGGDVMASGLWTAALVTAAQTAFGTWVTSQIGATHGGTVVSALVNVSYYEGSHVVTNPDTGRAKNVPDRRAVPIVDPIVASVARQVIGSQRRRNRKA